MELPLDKVRKVLKIAKEPISLETPIGEEEDSPPRRLHRGQGDHLAFRRGDQHEPGGADPESAGDAHPARREGAPHCGSASARKSDHTLEEVGQDFEGPASASGRSRPSAAEATPPFALEAAAELRRELTPRAAYTSLYRSLRRRRAHGLRRTQDRPRERSALCIVPLRRRRAAWPAPPRTESEPAGECVTLRRETRGGAFCASCASDARREGHAPRRLSARGLPVRWSPPRPAMVY